VPKGKPISRLMAVASRDTCNERDVISKISDMVGVGVSIKDVGIHVVK
jgi:hypothetical protein